MGYTFISGATGGIGKAFAFASAKKGHNLFLTGRNQGMLSVIKDQIKTKYKVDVITFKCDLTIIAQRNKLLLEIDRLGIKFDRLLNVAGVDIQKPFIEYEEEKVLMQIRVNAESTIALTHALLKRREDKMEILTVSSMSGVSPMPYFALYSATKAMLTNFFTSLHYELKSLGVKVTTVLPGGVYTRVDIIEQIKGQGLWGKLSAKTPQYVAERSLKAVRKNKLIYVPGGFNKFLYFIMRIAPKRLVLAFINKRWKKQRKDAF